MIVSGKTAIIFPYKLIDEILYFKNDDQKLRFCIPSALEIKKNQLNYDEMGHPGYIKLNGRFLYTQHVKKIVRINKTLSQIWG